MQPLLPSLRPGVNKDFNNDALGESFSYYLHGCLVCRLVLFASFVCLPCDEPRYDYGIMAPAATLTIGLGTWLLSYNFLGYLQAGWMQAKLILVVLLVIFHLYCGFLRKCFQNNQNQHSEKFYRYLNEFPTIILIGVVILTIVKP